MSVLGVTTHNCLLKLRLPEYIKNKKVYIKGFNKNTNCKNILDLFVLYTITMHQNDLKRKFEKRQQFNSG